MFISELFYSVQGEGCSSECLPVFIRTSGCNLRQPVVRHPVDLVETRGCTSHSTTFSTTPQNSTGYTVVTGRTDDGSGDRAADAILRELGQHITIETAGTICAPVACDLMSISPKLSNSTPEGAWRERHESTRLKSTDWFGPTTEFEFQLKFVVSRPEDLEEILDLAKKVSVTPNRVILMPEGTDDKTLSDRGQWISESCNAWFPVLTTASCAFYMATGGVFDTQGFEAAINLVKLNPFPISRGASGTFLHAFPQPVEFDAIG